MSNPSKLINTNRVKSITSKFEHLSEQSGSHVSNSKQTNSDSKTVDQTKLFTPQRVQLSKVKSDGIDNINFRDSDSQLVEGSKEKFGPSYNFGNRKRLKESENDDRSTDSLPTIATERRLENDSNLTRRSSLNIESTASLLSRQLSDPGKKLQRSPAFRCERTEKLKDSRKSSDSEAPIIPNKPNDRSKLSKDKLKRLGLLIEERMKQDNVEFKKTDSVQVNSVEEDLVIKNNGDSNDVPKHILAQYAQVVKPKIKSVAKKSFAKTDIVFSDSGVSSESENIISDDLDENDSPRNESKDFKSIRDNFESKGKNNVDRKLLLSPNQNPQSDSSATLDESDGINTSQTLLLANDIVKNEPQLTDTLKKVLKQPLPPGPAPKKPPRTFAAMEFPPTKPDVSEKSFVSRPTSKLNKSKVHRSKEESKLMLKKLENVLHKRESSGKILSPRPRKKLEIPSNVETSLDADTQSSPEVLLKNSKNVGNEIHYMCTEIFDLNFSDKENILNSSDASLNSLDASNSFTKCLNSLNCTNGTGRNSMSYKKFGSTNSNTTSVSNVCCNCSLTKEKNSKESNSAGSVSSQNIRLSTFRSPDNSLESTNDQIKCNQCISNENSDNSFKCHVNCTCADVVKVNETSLTFVEAGTSPKNGSDYGSLKKKKSNEEHIYAEPYDYIKRRGSPDNTKLTDLLFHPPLPLTRNRTQLEDGFGKIREADVKRTCPQTDEKFSPDDYFLRDSMTRMKNQRIRKDSESPPANNASIKKYPFLRSRTRLDDGFERIKDDNVSNSGENDDNKSNKVKDILSRLEGNRGSLKINKSALYSKEIPKSNDAFESHPDVADAKKLNKGLYYMSTKIYDIPYNSDDEADSKPSEDSIDTNTSFLYRQQFKTLPKRNSVSSEVDKSNVNENVKKPPLGDRRSSCDNLVGVSRNVRPSFLNLNENRNRSLRSRDLLMRRGSPTEADREKLTHLMSEIYDTVAEACVLDSPSSKEDELQPQSDSTDMGETTFKLTRSLTERRKRYVKRVSSHRFGTQDGQYSRPISLVPNGNESPYQSIKYSHFFVKTDSTKQESIDLNDEAPIVETDKLFDVCMLVGMNFTTGAAYVKSKYPKSATIPPQIESLIFPEAVDLSETRHETTRRATLKFKRLKCDAVAADVQTYSFVLTNEKGVRHHAYCRRVLPEGNSHTLPLAYCVIAKHRAPAFYDKVLQEIESHHGQSEVVMDSILHQLYNSNLPKSGYSITLKQLSSPKKSTDTAPNSSFKKNSAFRKSVNLGDIFNCANGDEYAEKMYKFDCVSSQRRNSSDISNHLDTGLETKDLSLMRSFEKIYGQDLKEFQKIITEKSNGRPAGISCNLKNNNNDINGNSEEIPQLSWTRVQIKRPLEPRIDENNLSVLYDSISIHVLVKIFGSLLLERKVIIIGDKLSQLSSCLEALQSILYPFVWQHTLISTIPAHLCQDLLEAPVPLLAGLLTSGPFQKESPIVVAEVESINFEEGMLVDISGSSNGIPAERVLKHQGDESTLLPPILAKTLITSLQLGTSISSMNGLPTDDHTKKARNVLVAEAFLRFFIEIMEGYKLYLKVDSYGLTKPVNKGEFAGPTISFEKEGFIKSHSSKQNQLFLEWFTETTMFSHFVEQKKRTHPENRLTEPNIFEMPYPNFYDIFDERLQHREFLKRHRSGSRSGSLSKSNYKAVLNKKVKIWRDKLKDLIN